MRIADLWPPLAWPAGDSSTLLRDVDDLDEDGWGDLIDRLGLISSAFARAQDRATDEWARRFPQGRRASV